jgi:hypothetical protein
MDNLPYAMILAGRATRRVAHSALPDAPVVVEPARRRGATARPRAAVARALRAAAAAVAPEPASTGGHDDARTGGVRARRGGACVPTS